MAGVSVRLNKASRTYAPGDTVSGVICIDATGSAVAHGGVQLLAVGQVSGADGGTSFSISSASGDSLLQYATSICGSGKLATDTSAELPFSFPVQPLAGKSLLDSFDGVLWSCRYVVSAAMKVSGFIGSTTVASEELEFTVEVPSSARPGPAPHAFEITSVTAGAGTAEGRHGQGTSHSGAGPAPRLKVVGSITSTACDISAPMTGELTVLECDGRITSIDLQLVRLESVGAGPTAARESTQVQSVQLVDGDPARVLAIPIWQYFPRAFTCPSVSGSTFSVAYEAHLVVGLHGGHTASATVPLKLYR